MLDDELNTFLGRKREGLARIVSRMLGLSLACSELSCEGGCLDFLPTKGGIVASLAGVALLLN